MALLKMDESFAGRYLNDGFSGGEKKRAEILQMAMLKPEIAIMDETDSGLDIDALRIVSEGVNALAGPELGVLVITHYQRILNYIKPHYVHVMVDGRILLSGGARAGARSSKPRATTGCATRRRWGPDEHHTPKIGVRDSYAEKYGFHDAEQLRLQVPQGARSRNRRARSRR